nr:oligosaccharide flippase family protein [Methanosarcina horonobensis]
MWFKDDLFQRLFKNAGTLLSANMIAWILGLTTFVLMARVLGPSQFGLFTLIISYVTLVDGVVNFQSWQAMIKYGGDALENKNINRFKGVVKFCTLIDVLTAIVGTITAILIVSIIGSWLSWNNDTVNMATFYSLTILFNLSGTPTGVLRLFNKFRLFAIIHIITATVKLTGIAIIFYLNIDLWTVISLYITTTIIGQILLFSLGWRELQIQGYTGVFKVPLKEINSLNPGIFNFVLTTNLTGSVGLGRKEVDTLIIGGIAGAEGAGLYKVAKQLASIPAMCSDSLYQSIYPELSKLWAKKEILAFKKLIIRSGLIAGASATFIWIGFIMFGSWAIQTFFGSSYVAAQSLTIMYMLAMVIAIFSFPLQPAMLSIGKPKISFWIQLVATIIYLITLKWLLSAIGIIGAGIAAIILYALCSISMAIVEIIIIEKMLKAVKKSSFSVDQNYSEA